MIVKQGKNFTTAKIFKKVCKTLFASVTTLSPNFLLNDRYFKIIVDTRTITENFHMTKVTFLHHFCGWALTFSIQIFEHIAWFALIDGSTARRCIAIVTNERRASYVIPLNSSWESRLKTP